MKDLDERVTRALEAVPRVAVRDDFAARVMERLPARSKREFVPVASRVGQRVSFVALAALAALMLGLAPWAWSAGHAVRMAVEWMLCAEFVGLTLWMSPVTRMRR